MNILIASDYRAPKSGNFIASLIALARKLRDDGNRVVFVFPQQRDWQEWLKREKFEVVVAGEESLVADKQYGILKNIVEKYHINLIHSHFGMFYHALVFNRKEMKDVKILMHDHMGFSLNPGMARQYIDSMARSIVYSIKRIRVISVMEKKNSSYVFLRKKWWIPNGLSLERNVDTTVTREDARKIMGLSDNDKLVLLLGWDLKRKGLDIAIKAIEKCREQDSNICLGVIGSGSEPTESVKQFIESETGIDYTQGWIRFYDSQEDIFAVQRAIDVFLSASRHEGFPYGLLEAISQNTPVAVSNIPSTRWAMEYTNSFFYETEDVEGCAKAVLSALNCGRSNSNYNEIIDKYSIEKWVKRVTEVYEKI